MRTRRVTRRDVLRRGLAGGALLAAPALVAGGSGPLRAYSANNLVPIPPAAAPALVQLALEPRERAMSLPAFAGRTLPLWTYTDAWPLVVRAPVDTTLEAKVTNGLGQHTDVHWHGLRNFNRMDGVSFLTQPPIEPGSSFTYGVPLTDTGTFFFHGHCDTITSVGRGLMGVLLVEGDEMKSYDGEVVLASKDWRIGDDGRFLPFTTDDGASRSGTFGTLRTVNGARNPVYDVPASADVRVRFLQVDPSRVIELGVEGGEAAVIAVDGHAVVPFPLETWRMGPAMRADLVIRTPATGKEVTLFDYFNPQPVALARLRSTGGQTRTGAFDPAPLYAPRFPEPDLANALPLEFVFSATAVNEDIPLPNGEVLRFADALCLTGQTFWAINKQSWPHRDMKRLPAPLATLERGRTYRITLHNATPVMHPIHIHGLVFKVLKSSKRARLEHWADTVLVMPKERLEIAIVADNPGDWMFHCHLLEHQETGMMGFIRIA